MRELPEDLQVHGLLQQYGERYTAPENLRQSIMQQLEKSHPRQSLFSSFNALSYAFPRMTFGFLTGALVATLLTWQWMVMEQSQHAMALALFSDHAHAVVAQNTLEVRSSSMHTVKPWLSNQLGYSPQIVDLGEQGFPLAGGRRGFVGAEAVAVAVYTRRQHEIDVYVLKPDFFRRFPANWKSLEGYNVIAWQSADLHYLAVSDLNRKELADFGSILEKEQQSL